MKHDYNMSDMPITDELLTSYLDGTATSAQQQAVEAWYLADGEHAKQLENYYLLTCLNDCARVSRKVDVERSLRELQRRIRRRSMFGSVRIWHQVAAVAAVLLLMVGGWWGATRVAESFSPAFTVATAAGERTQVTLPDGTKVWLNSCTELTYSSPLLGRERRVELQGEAYFEVTKSRPRHFVVRSEGLRTEVLGTRFNVRANPDDTSVTATLLEGSICASSYDKDNGDRLILTSGQQVTLDRKSGKMTFCEVDDDDNRIDWLNNCLSFRQQTLREITRELERLYNVTITIEGEELAEKRFSGEFDASKGIQQVLAVLQMAGKFSCRTSGSQLILYPQP